MKQFKKRLAALIIAVCMIASVFQTPAYAASKTPAPKVTSVTSSAYNKVTIKWKKVKGASKYAIYYKKGSKSWKKIATVKSDESSYTHKSSSKYPITVGKTYKYAVKAYKSKKWSGYSNTKSVKTIPNAVTLKSVTYNKSKQTVKLTWNKAGGCDKYRIYRKASGQESYKKIATVAKKNTSYTDKSPVMGKKNIYLVKGYYSKTKTSGKYKNKKSVVATKPHTHTYEWVVTKEATCAETGVKEYTCSSCGNVSETEAIAKKDHTSGTPVKENVIESTKDTEGSYDLNTYCTVCGELISTEHKTTPKLESHTHTYEWVVTKEATCVAEGEKTYTCTVCGATKTEAIKATGNHQYDNGKVTKEATCAADGEKTYTCSVCGATKTEAIKATGNHQYDNGKVTKEATCAANGEKTYTCTVCGVTKTEAIKATENHQYDNGKVTKEATCAANGEKTYTCTVCGVTKTEAIKATGNHQYDNGKVTKEATCAANGEKTYTCSGCGATKTEAIKATGNHQYDNGKVTKEATCAANGEKTYTCTVCGATKTEEIKATGNHQYDNGKVTKEATCAANGEKTYTCSGCGATKTEEIKATGNHQYDNGKVTKEATCAANGEKTYTCSGCGATKTEEIKATGNHQYDNGKVTKEATSTEEGEKTYTCIGCGVTKTERIPATGGSNDNNDNNVSAANINIAGGNESNQIISRSDAGNVDITKLKMSVSGDADCIQTNGGYYLEEMDSYVITIKGIKQGKAVLTVKFQDTVIKKYNVTVTSDSADYLEYKSWRQKLENQLWTSSMTDKEKLDAVESYIVNNFEYDAQSAYAIESFKTSKANCFGAAEMMGDFAKDLGLNIMYQERDSKNTYTNMSEALANYNGHVHTLVKINGTWYKYDATPGYGDGSNGGTEVTL